MEQRERLVTARLAKGWSQEEAAGRAGVARPTYTRWELGERRPYPVHIHRLCEIFGRSADELGLATSATVMPVISGASEEILESFTIGIAASTTLAENGARYEMELASQIAGTYIPVLQTMLRESSKYRLQAAALVSRLLQIQQGSAYHIEGLTQSVLYAEQSLKYARLSESYTDIIIALHHLATLYEWPLPRASISTSRKKGLELLEEAAHIQEKPQSNVPAVVQAWSYIGLSKFQALCAMKPEAHATIGKATEAYAKGGEDVPGLYFNETNLIRQQAIAHSYLNEQPQAVSQFLQLLDVNNSNIAPTMPMPARTHLSVISETAFSLLKLPNAKKDKELTIKFWLAEFEAAKAMESTTYLKEAATTLDIMECVWPDDASVLSLRDSLYS